MRCEHHYCCPIKRRERERPLPKSTMKSAMWVPAHVWTMIAVEVHAEGRRARSFLRLLTINKQIVGVARAVAARLGLTVQCTVAQIPRAVQVFEHARALHVVAGGEGNAVLEAARAALERAGQRFRAFVCDDTDAPWKMAWLPRHTDSGEYRVLVECSVALSARKRRFGDVVEGLEPALGMTELVLEYFGESDTYPNLAPLAPHAARGLRVTIQQADFTEGPTTRSAGRAYRAPSASFASAAVRELAFKGCYLGVLPPLAGFPNLKRLDVVGCAFYGEAAAVLRALASAQALEYLRLERCEGLGDASAIAALPSLKTLVVSHCRAARPEFIDEAARDALKAKLLSGELNADGAGCLCKEACRELGIRRAEREAARLVHCDSECCRLCECGLCSDSE